MTNRRGKVEAVTDFIFLGSRITADSDYSYEIKRCLLLERKTMTNLGSTLKSRDITLPSSHGLSSSHVQMLKLDLKEVWVPKNWCFQIGALEKTLGSPLHFKESQPVNPKGNQSWIFSGTMGTEAAILWPPDSKNWERPWCWEKLKAGGGGDNRWWDDWMKSLTQWTWIWASSGNWWRTEEPAVLHFMMSQRVRHNWVTKQRTTTMVLHW